MTQPIGLCLSARGGLNILQGQRDPDWKIAYRFDCWHGAAVCFQDRVTRASRRRKVEGYEVVRQNAQRSCSGLPPRRLLQDFWRREHADTGEQWPDVGLVNGAGCADEIAQIEAKLIEDIELHKQKVDADREELKGLGTLIFLTEPRYRDLKSRWGQVFKADMGAEAFLEILKRLDLNQMAKELWREVKTSKSKQKRKKAIKRLRVVESLKKSSNRW